MNKQTKNISEKYTTPLIITAIAIAVGYVKYQGDAKEQNISDEIARNDKEILQKMSTIDSLSKQNTDHTKYATIAQYQHQIDSLLAVQRQLINSRNK